MALTNQPLNTDITDRSNFAARSHGLPGEILKQARLAQNKTLADVTKSTNLPERHLTALEADQYDTLPEPTYVKGYIRAYAKYLGLPSDDMVKHYEETIGIATGPLATLHHSQKSEPRATPQPTSFLSTPLSQELDTIINNQQQHRPRSKGLLKACALVAFFVGMVWVGLQLPFQAWVDKVFLPTPASAPVVNPVVIAPAPAPIAAPVATAPVTTTPAVVTPPTAATVPTATAPIAALPATPTTTQSPAPVAAATVDTLHFDLSKDTDLTVFDERGNKLISGKQVMGKPVDVSGKAPFTVNIADASGVQMKMNDTAVDLTPHIKNGAVELRLAP